MSELTIEKIFQDEGIENPFQNRLELIKLVRRGISKKSILKLSELLSLSVKDFAKLLPVTERTIQRYHVNKRFKSDISEHIILIAEVIVKGLEVFPNQERLKNWLNAPNKSLDNTKPIELLDTSFGAQLVIDELGRMEYGVYS